jgi:hypothetical protein
MRPAKAVSVSLNVSCMRQGSEAMGALTHPAFPVTSL